MKDKFYRCKHCGNMFGVINDGGVTPVCCGEPMELVTANSVDAAVEKHIPEVEINGNQVNVTVGSVIHPMTEQHYIDWICVVTNRGRHRQVLHPLEEPKVTVTLANEEKVERVYAHCNLHGLWVKEL